MACVLFSSEAFHRTLFVQVWGCLGFFCVACFCFYLSSLIFVLCCQDEFLHDVACVFIFFAHGCTLKLYML